MRKYLLFIELFFVSIFVVIFNSLIYGFGVFSGTILAIVGISFVFTVITFDSFDEIRIKYIYFELGILSLLIVRVIWIVYLIFTNPEGAIMIVLLVPNSIFLFISAILLFKNVYMKRLWEKDYNKKNRT